MAGVFLWHPLRNELWKPYLRAEALERNDKGSYALRIDKLLNLSTTMYVTNEVLKKPNDLDNTRGLWQWLFGGEEE